MEMIAKRKKMIVKPSKEASNKKSKHKKTECERYHIDEYDEYYANYLSLKKENKAQAKRIGLLEKEIIILKHKLGSCNPNPLVILQSKPVAHAVETINRRLGIETSSPERKLMKSEERGSVNPKSTQNRKPVEIRFEIDEEVESSSSIENSQHLVDVGVQTIDIVRRSTVFTPIIEVNEEQTLKYQNSEEVGNANTKNDERNTQLSNFQNLKSFKEDKKQETSENFESMDVSRAMLRNRVKKSNSVCGDAKITQKLFSTMEILSQIQENNKLEEQIKVMQDFKKENEELKIELSKEKSKFTEQQQKLIYEKDIRIDQLSKTLCEREEKFKHLMSEFSQIKRRLEKGSKEEAELQKLVEEKEAELEKISYMNAEYRAQLIELKISMSKTRDLSRVNWSNDAFVVKINSKEMALEEAQEQLSYQESKIKEQESIIETLISQNEYYKSRLKE